MANQPSKYSKFVLGAASAALVASAVAPVASAATPDFKDIKGNTHEAAIKALVEARCYQRIRRRYIQTEQNVDSF